jgi:protein gp37
MAKRIATMPGPAGERYRRVALSAVGDPFAPAVHLDALDDAVGRLCRERGSLRRPRRPRPRRVFVGSMGDLCFAGRALAFGLDGAPAPMWGTAQVQAEAARFATRLAGAGHTPIYLTKRPDLLDPDVHWPGLAHVGVSVTGNHDAIRVAQLVAWREAIRRRMENMERGPLLWASVEPLTDGDFAPELLAGVEWVVVGLMTGPSARLGQIVGAQAGEGDAAVPITRGEDLSAAAEEIVHWCADRGVPCFVKDNLRKIRHRARPPMEWPRELPPSPCGDGVPCSTCINREDCT